MVTDRIEIDPYEHDPRRRPIAFALLGVAQRWGLTDITESMAHLMATKTLEVVDAMTYPSTTSIPEDVVRHDEPEIERAKTRLP